MSSIEDKYQIEQIAFSMTKGVHAEILRHMIDRGVTLTEFFDLDAVLLCDKLGISRTKIIPKSLRDEALVKARNEFEFVKRHGIQTLFLGEEGYPYRLAECYDAPVLIYMLGECNLDSEHIVSMVGTRKATHYGSNFCSSTVKQLYEALCGDIMIVSGLAYGIDAIAHTACLENGVPTVACLAHGLNMIYPATHRSLAQQIIKSGGALITEYPSTTKPFRQHFLERNRIVAGLSDATVVVESDIKGGAMSTAQFAFSYNREVMALPGRNSDQTSRGCNQLIRKNKASLIESAIDIVEQMDWIPKEFKFTSRQRVLFDDLSEDEQPIYDMVRNSREEVTIAEIHNRLKLPMSQLQSILTEMEFNGIIVRYPGNKIGLAL